MAGRSEKEKVLVMRHEKTHPITAGFEDGMGHNPRNTGSLLKLEKTKKMNSLLEPPEEIQPS